MSYERCSTRRHDLGIQMGLIFTPKVKIFHCFIFCVGQSPSHAISIACELIITQNNNKP